MKLEWSKWNVGGKLIFAASCLAVVSMFMNWVDIGITARIGISQGAFLLLGFWIYPVYMLLKNRSIKLRWGLPSATLSVIAVIIYIASKSSELAGQSNNFSAIGAWLFLIASIALVIGVAKYHPIGVNIEKTEEKNRKLRILAKGSLFAVLLVIGLFFFGFTLFAHLDNVSWIHPAIGLVFTGLAIWLGISLKRSLSR